jgi:DNA-binding response OmpR family regulator
MVTAARILPMPTRIAVLDDDAVSRDVAVSFLASQGFEATAYADASALRAALSAALPDLVLLDLRMPGEDGLSVLRWLRGLGDLPVIMLTSAEGVTDRVVGLEMGADDYVPKSAEMREVVARIRSVLRRRGHASAKRQGTWFGRWRLDRDRHCLVDATGQVLAVTAAEFGLLAAFAEHPRTVLSRDRLLELSGADADGRSPRAIDMRITRLRQKIEPMPKDPTVIRTVRGHGGGYEYVPADDA